MLLATALILAHLTTSHNLPGSALATLLIAIVVARLMARWLLRSGIWSLPLSRISSTNLIGTPRGSVQPPQVWLVAHLDSKSQTIPMLVRVAAIATSSFLYIVSTGMLVGVVILRETGISPPLGPHDNTLMGIVWLGAFAGAAAMLPIIFCFISNKSHGALDNASGVAAIALALEMVRDRERVGVIITSGEELGLAGARALATTMPMTAVALNCDTIDDNGRFICMSSRRMSDRLSRAIDRAAQRTEIEVRKQGMIPGILADNVAFTDAGWESFTLSRGNLGTLARVHTSRDRAGIIDGTGIVMAAQLLAATAEELS